MRRRVVICLIASVAILGVLVPNAFAGTNLLVNGDFSQGLTGFTTQYTTTQGLGPPQAAGVGPNPQTMNGAWPALGDHTNGHGNMLVVNGPDTANVTLWSEKVTVSAGARYVFTLWIASLYSDPARLRVLVNGKTILSFTAPLATGVWTRERVSWPAGGASAATISIVDDNLDSGGNDFALDDLSFDGPGGNPRLSTLASSIPKPSDALSSGKKTVENLAIAGGVALFITFPAQLFNHTFDENYADIRDWWLRRFGFLEKLRRLIAGKTEKATEDEEQSNTFRDTVAAVLVVLFGALLGSLLDPHFGLHRSSVLTFGSVVAATTFGIAIGGLVNFRYRKQRSLKTAFHLHALPAGLLIATGCVLVSRVAGFEPGYLYGLVCGVAFAGTLDARQDGQTVVLGELTTLTVALIAWGLLVPLDRLATHPHEAWPVLVGADFFGALFTGGIVGSMIGALPLEFLPGGKVAKWHRGVWGLMFALIAFLFLELILEPGRGGHKGHAPLVTVIVLFVIFGIGSVVFYWHFSRKDKAKEAAEKSEPAEAEPPETPPQTGAMPGPEPASDLPT